MFICIFKNFFMTYVAGLPQGKVRKSGKTKKNEKSQEKVFLDIRFCQFKFTKFLILKSL